MNAERRSPDKSGERLVALLRGANVGGSSVIKMADLRAAFESLGFTDVVTYIQSGNVVFSSTRLDRKRLSADIEARLAAELGYRGGAVFLFTAEDLAKAAANNPFEPARLEREQLCHLMFLSAEPDLDRQRALLALQGKAYRFAFHESVLYYAYPREFAGKRRGIDFEKVLGVVGTGRTWKVVDQLIRLARA
jgi:uncharacterized protein (DUF1697 family)